MKNNKIKKEKKKIEIDNQHFLVFVLFSHYILFLQSIL